MINESANNASAPRNETEIVNPASPKVNRIILGDCAQVLRQLPDESVDMILTDPSYIVNYHGRDGRSIANDDNSCWLYPAFSELHRVLKHDRFCLSFYGWCKVDRFLNAWRECGFHVVGHFVWIKQYASQVRYAQAKNEQAFLLAKGQPKFPLRPPADVLPWKYTGNRFHPTQKPICSLVPVIEAYSQRGEPILDAFAGSGSTGVTARYCHRRFILIEKDPAYYHQAVERLR